MAKPPKKPLKRLAPLLNPGQSIRIIGVSGKAVKRPRRGRKYTVEVVEKRKVIGFLNAMQRGKAGRTGIQFILDAAASNTLGLKRFPSVRGQALSSELIIENSLKIRFPTKYLKEFVLKKDALSILRSQFRKTVTYYTFDICKRSDE